ncbi:MAG: hypothetical protein P1U36_01635 [Legionellaceae bacterium]|nr:hypothetical protein [Legionellaceae bacterium]
MKFKNLSIAIFLSTLMCSACAQQVPEHEKMIDKIRADLGVPEFKSGVKVVPRSRLGMPDKVFKEDQAEAKQRKRFGYVEKNMPYAVNLLKMETTAPIQIKQYEANLNEQGTHLRQSVNDLKLAFKFKEITHDKLSPYGLQVTTMLGAAPQGDFHEESGGWSGVAQFFVIQNLGTCVYGMRSVKASGGAALLAKEDVVYNINDKATLVKVDGSQYSGFLYQVEWFDKNNVHKLECANTQYSKHIKDEVINLARTIDGM